MKRNNKLMCEHVRSTYGFMFGKRSLAIASDGTLIILNRWKHFDNVVGSISSTHIFWRKYHMLCQNNTRPPPEPNPQLNTPTKVVINPAMS